MTSEVPIDDDDSHEDTDSVHDEGEEKILGDEGEHERGGREDLHHYHRHYHYQYQYHHHLGDEQQEHNQ